MDDVSSCTTATVCSVHAVEQHRKYFSLNQSFERVLFECIESLGVSNAEVGGIRAARQHPIVHCHSIFLRAVLKTMEMEELEHG